MGIKKIAIGGIAAAGIITYTYWNADLAWSKLDLLLFGDNPQQAIAVQIDQEVLNRAVLDTTVKEIQVDLIRQQADIEALKLQREQAIIQQAMNADLTRIQFETETNAWTWAVIYGGWDIIAYLVAPLLALIALCIMTWKMATRWATVRMAQQEYESYE